MVTTKKLRDLCDRICSFENLLAAYREAAKDKRFRGEVIKFSLNLEENLLKIRQDLLNQTYTCGGYREFYVHYPKPRLVMALQFPDRIVQHAIYRQINPFIDKRFINHSYGCRKDKGTLVAALCLLHWIQLFSRRPDAGDYVLIKGDISKYFYRVDHGKITEIYQEFIDDPWFFWLLDVIVNNPDVPFGLPAGVDISQCPPEERLYDVGMPIGNLTSQETANIYLDKLDRYCKHKLRIRYYIRYMDDFIIIAHKDSAAAIMEDIAAYLKAELLLDISPKSRILPVKHGCEFVGYQVSPHGIRLRKKTTKHIKNSLLHVAELYAVGAIDYDGAMQSINSYVGMLEHCNGYNLKRWIAENVVLKRMEEQVVSEKIAGANKRRYYSVVPQEDGTADVYLFPDTEENAPAGGASLYVVRGVVLWEGLETDIRRRYSDWCASAEPVGV